MTEPASMEEYLERFKRNQWIRGAGIGNVFVHMPCPFCAAVDFMVYELLQTAEVMRKDTLCRECGRSAKAVFHVEHGGTAFEIVQTGGPDVPDWMPKMRRVQ